MIRYLACIALLGLSQAPEPLEMGRTGQYLNRKVMVTFEDGLVPGQLLQFYPGNNSYLVVYDNDDAPPEAVLLTDDAVHIVEPRRRTKTGGVTGGGA
eukprot:CAMPEP_0204262610 /NCGR_PEP_ID=MMETSP0468-20130131/7797_1 /ASSEMBLY_ACC=CAM_ASM_000383 /TAXON_ID=2969 /ORGANISM="Oxyrrhis marina" /LENGTH=96 /DNA_ID=CAMNT_0051237295 /DNA_START=74 /DNA_END=364 /DNA_ORIENTATION=+